MAAPAIVNTRLADVDDIATERLERQLLERTPLTTRLSTLAGDDAALGNVR